MKTVNIILFLIITLTTISTGFAEPPATETISNTKALAAQCCKEDENIKGPIIVNPLELLKAIDPKQAELAETLGKLFTGEARQILHPDDLKQLEELGMAKASQQWMLRSVDAYKIADRSWLEHVNYNTDTAFHSGCKPITGKLVSQNQDVTIACFSRNRPETKAGETIDWIYTDKYILWVQETIYTIDFGNAKKLVAVPFQANSGAGTANPVYLYYIEGSLPSEYYAIEAYVEKFSDKYIQSLLNGQVAGITGVRDFLVDLIPYTSTVTALKDGSVLIAVGNAATDTALLFLAGLKVPCKLLAAGSRCRKAVDFLSDAGTVYAIIASPALYSLVFPNNPEMMQNGNNTFDRARASLVVSQWISVLILKKKPPNVITTKIGQIYNLGNNPATIVDRLSIDNIICNSNQPFSSCSTNPITFITSCSGNNSSAGCNNFIPRIPKPIRFNPKPYQAKYDALKQEYDAKVKEIMEKLKNFEFTEDMAEQALTNLKAEFLKKAKAQICAEKNTPIEQNANMFNSIFKTADGTVWGRYPDGSLVGACNPSNLELILFVTSNFGLLVSESELNGLRSWDPSKTTSYTLPPNGNTPARGERLLTLEDPDCSLKKNGNTLIVKPGADAANFEVIDFPSPIEKVFK